MSTRSSTVNIVVGGLVLITLALLALVGTISIHDTPGSVPEALWTLLGGTTGALAAMLARTTSDPAPPAPPPAQPPGPGNFPGKP